MLLEAILKKKKQDPNRLIATKPDEDFLPYVCHYNENTILTKNGELLQIIRVTGFNSDSASSDLMSLREALRDAIAAHVKDNKFAFWFNTIRRKKDISPEGKFKNPFAKEVNNVWVEENDLNDRYVNELYVTIITEGVDTSIVNFTSFFRSFSYLATKSLHSEFLDGAHQRLSKVTNGILKDIESYGAKLLGVVEWDDVLYSEPIRFFGKISNLYEERYPLAANDISSDLSSHKIAFGDRELEVVGYDNKNFAAMLSLKEYYEVPTAALDRILQLPFEFIITQSFDFANTSKDLESCQYQNYILEVSGDEDFRQLSGVANFIESKTENETINYGKLQTTIMIISKNHKELEKDICDLIEQFSSLGFVLVREDIFLEHCFWAQLPGNFRYLSRQKAINVSSIAGFSSLYNFPSGSVARNNWGPAVTVFHTVLNTPYFFNFYYGKANHCLILGPKEHGQDLLTNFLVTQSLRFDPKIFYFDFDGSAKTFINALGGDYYNFVSDDLDKQIELNPLKDNDKEFLVDFFKSLISFSKDPIPEEEIKKIPQIIDQIIIKKSPDFASAVEIFKEMGAKTVYSKLKIWTSKKLKHIFGSKQEIACENKINAFDLEEISKQKPIVSTITNYLLHKVETLLDDAPSIIVLSQAWQLIDNKIIAPKFVDFLNRAREKNCVVILASSNVDLVGKSKLTPKLMPQFGTQFFLPNHEESSYYQEVFGLDEEESEIVNIMEESENQFLLKHGDDSVIATINFDKHPEIARILSCS